MGMGVHPPHLCLTLLLLCLQLWATTGSGSVSSNANGSIAGSVLAPSYNASSSSKASTPTNAGVKMGNAMTNLAWGAGTYPNPKFFPFGGYVALRVGGLATSLDHSSASDAAVLPKTSGALSGVWEIQAACQYVPE